ncbi:hypothetical protein TELCIR_03412 [Teladorsagia circumcincta]|uniref:BPTI/Kunitz inhibitor domain-containing protein n=1 Tax=Teladorsagia circumcincta TaxID=45464 RepID=A0A2G9UYJ7_TELCI|nr:hypothetical protein TELCIR_03412 [Teladorsagia circumcincta]
MGICCANRTELLLLYGNDNQKHADPIWNRKDPIQSVKTTSTTAPPSPQLSTPKVNNVAEANTDFHGSLTTSTSSSVSTTEEASSSFPALTTPPNEENSVVVTENDEVFDETSPASETVEEKSVSIDGSSASNSTGSTVTTAAGETSISTDLPKVKIQENSTQKQDESIGEQAKSSSLPIQTKRALNSFSDKGTETDSTASTSGNATVATVEALNTTVNEKLDYEDASEGSSAPIEDSVKVFSARVDDETLTGGPDHGFTDPDVEEPTLKKGQSAANKTAHDVDRRDATGDSPLVLNGAAASEEGQSTEKNAVVEAVDIAPSSNKTTEKLEDSNKGQKISDILQNNEQDTSPPEDEQTTYCCERQPYIFRCRSNSVDTQPTIRWYLSENGECEYYPWGYCPGDRIAESTTIRTKTECERECMKKEKGGTKGALPEVPAGFSDDDEKTEAELEQKVLELQEKPENTSSTPEGKNTAVEPSAVTDSGEQRNDSSSSFVHDKAVNTATDQVKEVVSDALPAVTELDTTSTIDKSSNQSDVSPTDEEKALEGEVTENSSILSIVETSQNQTTETKAVVAVTIERKENVLNEGSRKHICDDLNEGNQTTTETDESKQTETELAEGSGEAGDEKSKGMSYLLKTASTRTLFS